MTKMLIDRSTVEQALEALEQSETFVPYEGFGMARRDAERKHQAAITALREALSESEQEPVAWVEAPYGEIRVNPLYRLQFPQSLALSIPLYTTPPPRNPLTDEEIDKLPWGPRGSPMTFNEGLRDFARAIERAHGIGEANE